MDPASPAWRPPSPTAITGPRSGSLTAPTSTSAPGSTSRCTIAPIHSRSLSSLRRSSSSQPARIASSPSRPSSTASKSAGLSGGRHAAFRATGAPTDAAASLTASLDRPAPDRRLERDPMRGQQLLALRTGPATRRPRSRQRVDMGARRLRVEALEPRTLAQRPRQPLAPLHGPRQHAGARLGEDEVGHGASGLSAARPSLPTIEATIGLPARRRQSRPPRAPSADRRPRGRRRRPRRASTAGSFKRRADRVGVLLRPALRRRAARVRLPGHDQAAGDARVDGQRGHARPSC